MKKNIVLSLAVCLTFAFAFSKTTNSLAQSADGKKPSKAGLITNTIRNKKANGGFVILPPSEAARFVASSRSNVEGADPCDVATPIEFTQSVMGALTNTDCRLDDNSYADFYTFNAIAGERATIDLGSGTFDSYLGLSNETGTYVVEDDDSGGGFNARIDVTLPETGLYVILANSVDPNSFGSYSLSLNGGPNCTFQFSPSSAEIPATGGSFSFQVTTQPRCYWAAGSVFGEVTTTSTGLGSGTVNYTVANNPVNQDRVMNIGIRNNYFNMRQAAKTCTYTMTPSTISIPATQTSGSFTVNTQPGCFWSAQPQGSFLSATGSGNGIGAGTVNYSAPHNNGAARSSTIRVGSVDQYQNVSVDQAGLNCTYSVTPTSLTVPASGASGNYVINTQTGCTWFLTRSQLWIELQMTGLGSGPASIPYTILPMTDQTSRSGAFQFSWAANDQSNSINSWVDQSTSVIIRRTRFDFDGDGKSDPSVYRPSNNAWYLLGSQSGFRAYQFGATDDILTPADFTGDGKTDLGVWRPSVGTWFVLRSEDNTFYGAAFGSAGDVPAPGDYDGDGKADLVVMRPGASQSFWFLQQSTAGFSVVPFGLEGDVPTIGDYDGDGKNDVAVYRPTAGAWFRFNSLNGSFLGVGFGQAGDKVVPADYTGDGKTDLAVFRTSNSIWYILRSEDNSLTGGAFGAAGDLPSPGDYDGDGKADLAVWRPGANATSQSFFFLQQSTSGFAAVPWGLGEDKPIPGSYVY